MIPEPWEFTLLFLAAFRIWKLVADDVIFESLRNRLLDRWEAKPRSTSAIVNFLECPACLGFWCFVAWWGGWLIWPTGALVLATPFAGSAAVLLLFRVLDEPPRSD